MRGRKVKCCITHEYGSSTDFIKINGKYYKSQQVYDTMLIQRQAREDFKALLMRLIGYEEGQPYPKIVDKKIAELKFYQPTILLATLQYLYKSLEYHMQNKVFVSDFSKISYIFAAISNNINDIRRKEEDAARSKILAETSNCGIEELLKSTVEDDVSHIQHTRDISRFLDDEGDD